MMLISAPVSWDKRAFPQLHGFLFSAVLATATLLYPCVNWAWDDSSDYDGSALWAADQGRIKSTCPTPPPPSGAEARKADYRQGVATQNPGGFDAMAILAKEGIEIPKTTIIEAVNNILTSSVGDFRLAEVVRVLYLAGDRYDQDILPRIEDLDFWLTQGEEQYVYWSENHMILWTSSAYLLKQRQGWPMDSYLEQRLNHYLDLKNQYGFYEFFSTDYYRFTLGALLNLADFAKDGNIQNKATAAAKRMMREMLMVFNDIGAYYPAAGRNYTNHYTQFRPQSIFWMITGKGPKLTTTDYAGAFLATSPMSLDDVAVTYTSSLNTTLVQGHEPYENTTVHAGFPRQERTIFQWSAGGYFHPDTASDTAYTVDYFDLENRSEFKDLANVAWLPDSWMGSISKIGAVYSRASSISSARINIFKNSNIVLTSLEDYYPGYKGYQQWPWAATVEDIAVWTQTGDIPLNFEKQGSGALSQNSHLPKVQQNGNVALVTYFPKFEIGASKNDKGVNLYWPKNRFDENEEMYGHRNGNWLVARKKDSYIAVLRYGTGIRTDGNPREWGDKGRQMWAVVVGNKSLHGSYENFKDIVRKASIKETYNFDVSKFRKVYFTRIDVDGKYIRNWW
ncbi:MAG: hypothetical protein MUC50_04825 [Myxococcota bacterium]|jgi:hypothetical protein|nr:hypothetical protein [Myxococcota bacterium]